MHFSSLVLLPALAKAALLPGRQPIAPVGRRYVPYSNETLSTIPSDVSTTDTGISTDTGIATETDISTDSVSTPSISTPGVSTPGISTDVSITGISTDTVISTDTGVVSTTTAPEPSTTALAVITPDPATVSADITETVEGVTENTLHTSTNDDGSTTVLPILFGTPCLMFCNDIGPGGGPGAIILHGIGPGPGNYILPPIAGVVPPPSAIIIQNGVPTPVPSGTEPEDPDEDEDDEVSSTEDSSTTEASSTTESSTASETAVASYGLTTIVVDYEPSDVTTETSASGTAAASYGLTTIVVDFEPSDVTSGTPTSGTAAASYGLTTIVVDFEPSAVTSETPTSGTAAASYGVTTIVVDFEPSDISTPASQTSTSEASISTSGTAAASYGVTTVVVDYTPTASEEETSATVTSDSDTSETSAAISTTPPTTLVTSTSSASETATETGPPLCVPYQNPREGLSYCQCSSDGVVATMPILSTGRACPYTTFTLPPTTTAPPVTSPVYTFTAPDGAVIACEDYSTWGIGGSITATSCFEPSTTISEAPGPTGDPQECIFQGSYFSDADCFLGICGSTRHDHGSMLYIPGEDEPDVLWSDNETEPSENQPWDFDEDSIGIQESMSFNWDGDQDCGCNVDGEDVEGEMIIYEDGDGGFTYWSEDWVCSCKFQCHPSG